MRGTTPGSISRQDLRLLEKPLWTGEQEQPNFLKTESASVRILSGQHGLSRGVRNPHSLSRAKKAQRMALGATDLLRRMDSMETVVEFSLASQSREPGRSQEANGRHPPLSRKAVRVC